MATRKAAMEQQKQLETRIHTQLYDYLVLLRQLHPTTKDFDAVLKPDMFVKNNKTAFQHIIYYLLKTLNPKTIKQHICSWPIFDHKMDQKFRREVQTYVNDLKHLYPDSEIPSVVTSHLISPGGFKFACLMLNLTRLIVTEVLHKEGGENMLRMPREIRRKFQEHSSIVALNFATLTADIEAKTAQKLKAHYKKMQQYQMDADDISRRLVQSKTNIPKLQKVLANLQAQNTPEANVTNADIDALEALCAKVQVFQHKFNHCNKVLNYIMSNNCYVDSETSSDAKHHTGGNTVKLSSNLLEHFDMFQKMCQVRIFDVRRVQNAMVENKMAIIQMASQKYDSLLEKCSSVEKQQKMFLEELGLGEGTDAGELSHTLRDNQSTPLKL